MAVKTTKGTTVSDEDALNVIDTAVSKGIEKLKVRFTAQVDTEGAALMRDFSRSVMGHVVEVTSKYQDGVEKQDFTVMPIGTRLFKRKNTIDENGKVVRHCQLLIEQTPQVRVCSFRRDAHMTDNDAAEAGLRKDMVDRYSLAFPYVLFAFRFALDADDNVLGGPAVSTAFALKPVSSSKNKVYRSLLPNVGDAGVGSLCMGTVPAPNNNQSLADYVHEFVRTYWQSTWTRDYNQELVRVQEHDPRLSSLGTWESNSVQNSLFILKNKKSPYGYTYKEAFSSIEDWLRTHFEVDANTSFDQGRSETKKVERLMRAEVDKLVAGFGKTISGIEISGLHHPAHQVRVLKQFLEDFLGQATIEMRRLYEGRLVDQLRELEKRLNRNAKEALASPNEVFDPEGDMTSPW